MPQTSLEPTTILDRLRQLQPDLYQRYGITKIGIFGSVARNTPHANSDIDIVVEMQPNILKRACLKAELEEVFGCSVDVIRYWDGMNPYLKSRIDREAKYARSLLFELFLELDEAITRVDRRFSTINKSADFTATNDGLDRLDAIAMMLLAISENVQRIENIAGSDCFDPYPEVNWPGVKGIRNILAHDYFSIDAEEIFNICQNDLPILKRTLKQIRTDLFGYG